MNTNATIREAENNAAATVLESETQETIRESGAFASAFIGLRKFRDYDIVRQLPTSGGESDIYVVEKDEKGTGRG